MKELNFDTFSELINKFITEAHMQVLIDMPEGTQEVTVEDNIDAGPAVQYFVLIQAMKKVWKDLMQIGEVDQEKFLDSVWELLKAELLEDANDR